MSSNLPSAIRNLKSRTAQRGFIPRRLSRALLPLLLVTASGLALLATEWSKAKAAPEAPESYRPRLVELFGRPLTVGPMMPVAMTFVVNTTNDTVLAGACAAATPGQCSLREAMVEANANPGDDTIDATGITGTINLTGVLPDITEGVTINGPGASLLTVRRDTGGNYRIFNVTTAGTVTFFGLTASNGDAGTGDTPTDYQSGGGIGNNFGGTVNVTNCTISGNSVGHGGAGGGIASNGIMSITNSTIRDNFVYGSLGACGGIFSTGTMNITNSAVSDNVVNPNGAGGGICNHNGTLSLINSTVNGNKALGGGTGGGIGNDSTLNVINSTITGNIIDDGVGGGIAFGTGTVNVTNSTISGNFAGFESGGIDNGGGTLNLKSSIVALNTSPSSPDLGGRRGPIPSQLPPTFISQGYNVIGTTSGAVIVATTGDQFGVTAAQLKLGPLANNGGPTRTMALESGSVAIDRGINSNSLTRDQRGAGFARTFDDPAVTNATGGDGTDVGAFEAQPPDQPPVAKCKNIQVSADSSCLTSIVPADVDNGSFDPDPGDTITLTLDNSGPFGLGAHTVTLTATDNQGLSSSCTATVTVVDNTNPAITGVSANPSSIWPPNKKMVPVTVNYTTSDGCTTSPVSVLSVSSNEGTSADWEIVDAHHVKLRADRNGNGSGRIYTITITSTDASGNSTIRTVLVTVPHDQGH